MSYQKIRCVLIALWIGLLWVVAGDCSHSRQPDSVTERPQVGGVRSRPPIGMDTVRSELEYLERSIRVDKRRLAMAEIRLIGTAIEYFAINNGYYPGPTGKRLADLDFLGTYLTPSYLTHIDLHDPWGGKFRYWSNRRSYAIVSGFSDGNINLDYSDNDTRARCDEDSEDNALDMSFVDGLFCGKFGVD